MLSEEPSSDEIYQVNGILLISTQTAELVINHCLRLVIRFRQAPTIDEVYALNEPERKKTLGDLLPELRESLRRSVLRFLLLKSFLKNRNTFAHKMSFLPGWNLQTKAGREVAVKFLERHASELVQVRNIFLAFTRPRSQNWAGRCAGADARRTIDSTVSAGKLRLIRWSRYSNNPLV